jgi:molecular chaperone GrpE
MCTTLHPEDGDVQEAVGREKVLENEVASLNEQVLRLRAEMENYRKRIDRTTHSLIRQASATVLRDVLSVADDLDRAVVSLDGALNPEQVRAGVELTRGRIRTLLERQGVVPIEAVGAFDPIFHEAVATHPTADLPPGTITREVQRGYRWGEEVLRASRVEVAVVEAR